MSGTNDLPPRTDMGRMETRRWWLSLLICLALFAVTAIVYWPACQHDFVREWDDNSYVYNQPHVLNGISWNGLRWAATANVGYNWHPLTVMSLQLDAQLFGKEPMGFHRTSVLLHSLNASLLYLAIMALTGCRVRSAIVAAMFALHPARVESVAWISERKDVLSGLFFFSTILAYVHYSRRPSIARYALVAISLAMGLISKPMLVTTPCVLLLLDYWPLGRSSNSALPESHRFIRLVLEKLPLFGLSLATAVITVAFQRSAIAPLSKWTLAFRLQNSVVSYFDYARQTLVPLHCSPHYAFHEITVTDFCVALIFLILLTGVAIIWRNQYPSVLTGWLIYLGTLVPVIGLIQVGHVARADRYLYLPQVGLFIGITWGISDLANRIRGGRFIAGACFGIYLAICLLVTTQLIPIWHNAKSLWTYVGQVSPDDSLAQYFQGKLLFEEGHREKAIHFLRSATEHQDGVEEVISIASLLSDCGDYEGSVAAYTKSLEKMPKNADLLSNRAKSLAALGKWTEAAEDFHRAMEQSPKQVSLQFYLAHALAKSNQLEESNQILSAALKSAPTWPESAAKLAWEQSTSKDPSYRVNFWPVCLAEQANLATGSCQPKFLDILAATYANAGRFDDAISTVRRAIQLAETAHSTISTVNLRRRLELYEKHEAYRE